MENLIVKLTPSIEDWDRGQPSLFEGRCQNCALAQCAMRTLSAHSVFLAIEPNTMRILDGSYTGVYVPLTKEDDLNYTEVTALSDGGLPYPEDMPTITFHKVSQ